MASETGRPKARMPSDEQIRRALIESGMPEREAARALSPYLRPLRLDLFRRRRNRLLKVVQERLLQVAAQEKLLGILKRECGDETNALNLEDLFAGVHRAEMANLGEDVVRQAIEELAAEGVVAAGSKGAGMEVVRLTGREPRWTAAKLREVYARLRGALGVKGPRPYLIEKTWDL